jgi:hypothetical protein
LWRGQSGPAEYDSTWSREGSLTAAPDPDQAKREGKPDAGQNGGTHRARPGGKLNAGKKTAGALSVDRGHEKRDRTGIPDAERVHGLHELAAHDGGDAVAVEERLDHEGLRLIAAAAHLHEARGWLGRGGCLRKRYDLAPSCHDCDLYHS